MTLFIRLVQFPPSLFVIYFSFFNLKLQTFTKTLTTKNYQSRIQGALDQALRVPFKIRGHVAGEERNQAQSRRASSRKPRTTGSASSETTSSLKSEIKPKPKSIKPQTQDHGIGFL
jgi:hypothetical protein